MKKILKFLSSILLVSTLGFANCHYDKGGDQMTGYIMAALVKSAASGNCAVSLNLGSLYAGAILQGAVAQYTTNTAALFGPSQYEAASGSTMNAQGYGASTATLQFAQVPFNKKYDAFLTTNGSWTAETRNAALAAQKAQIDSNALTGGIAIITGGVSNATTQANVSAFYSTFSNAEKTAMVTAQTGVTTLSGSATTVANLDTIITTNAGTAIANAANAAAYLQRSSWRSGQALLACGRLPRSSCNLAAISTDTLTNNIISQVAVANLILTTPECRKNTTALGAAPFYLSTNSLRIQTAVFAGLSKDTITPVLYNGLTYQNSVLESDKVTATQLASQFGATEGAGDTASIAFNNRVLIASKAYPKSAALALQSFGAAFPLATGTTAYAVTAGTATPTSQTQQGEASTPSVIPWYANATNGGQGSNIGFVTVESCEAIGLGGVGPTPVTSSVGSSTGIPAMTSATVDTWVTAGNRKALKDVKELVYAFSNANAAATTYAALNGVGYTSTLGALPITITGQGTQGFDDAVACNKALRKTVAVPFALGVGTKLSEIQTGAGDGGAGADLTMCIYGGTTVSRTGAAQILSAQLLNITTCSALAATGASTFGEYGLTSLSSFPNGKE